MERNYGHVRSVNEMTDASTFALTFPCALYSSNPVGGTVIGCLARLFYGLTNQMWLKFEPVKGGNGAVLRAIAGARTRATLFAGDSGLEVQQTVKVSGSTVSVTLEWLHKIPQAHRLKVPQVARGVLKRDNFIRLFNSTWTRKLRHQLCAEINTKLRILQISAETAKALRQDLRLCFTKTECSETLKAQTRSPTPYVPSSKKRMRAKSVTFARKPSIVYLPIFSEEERKYRMSSGEVFVNGKQKPLVSVKSGEFITYTVTQETLQKIAPCSYPEALTMQVRCDGEMRRVVARFDYLHSQDMETKDSPDVLSNQEYAVKVVPHDSFAATFQKSLTLKVYSPNKRFRPEANRTQIVPFNYEGSIDVVS